MTSRELPKQVEEGVTQETALQHSLLTQEGQKTSKRIGFLTLVVGLVLTAPAPADLRKEGPAYDLPIALGILLASEQLLADVGIVSW